MLRSAIGLLSTIKATQNYAKSEGRNGVSHSLINLEAGHLAWYPPPGRSQGFVFKNKNQFQNTLFVRQVLVNIEHAN